MPSPFRFHHREHALVFASLIRGILFGALVGVLCGISSALFLLSLEWATSTRERIPALLWGLPLAGVLVTWGYERFGKSVASGNNLLLDRIHDATVRPIPFRMAPLIFLGTIITHLFGGSAGREGSAVQMGGAFSELLCRVLRLGRQEARQLIQAGISGGFGAIFGTPLAGAVFGLEVLSIGGFNYAALTPCVVASFVGDLVCRAMGVHHAVYTAIPMAHIPWLHLLPSGVLFAIAAYAFIELTDVVAHLQKTHVRSSLLRPVIGGIAVIGLTYAVGTRDYLGLSLPLISQSFTPEGVVLWAWALKIVFTAVTLGSGFKGGEVTPLFAIGATLGAAYATLTHQPTAYFAALGFVAVFAGAANTPLACTLLAIELFGREFGMPALVVCLIAYLLTGHRGIYGSQRVAASKTHTVLFRPKTRIREARDGRFRTIPPRTSVPNGGSVAGEKENALTTPNQP